MTEWRFFFELLGMLVTDPRTGVLLALLAAAAVYDYRTFRIPNLITGGGIVFALIYNGAVPPEMHAGWNWAPAGMLLGLGAMLPLYALRTMGAGDVKLMAMVGSFLGVSGTASALLFCLITGGVAAIVFASKNRVMGRMLVNIGGTLRTMFWSSLVNGDPRLHPREVQSVGKMAYGISIAVGTSAFLLAQQFNLV